MKINKVLKSALLFSCLMLTVFFITVDTTNVVDLFTGIFSGGTITGSLAMFSIFNIKQYSPDVEINGNGNAGGIVDKQVNPASIAQPKNLAIVGTDYLHTNDKKFQAANQFIIPEEIAVNITSDDAAGDGGVAVATDIYLFNNDLFGTVIGNGRTDAGEPIGISYEWSDGYEGLVISWILAQSRAAMGMETFGFSVACTDQNGVGKSSATNLVKPSWEIADGLGNFVPAAKSTAGNRTRKDFEKNITVVLQNQNVYRLVRHKLTIQPDTIMSLCYYTTPYFSV